MITIPKLKTEHLASMTPERLQKIKIREQNKDFRQVHFPQPDETETMELIQHIERVTGERDLYKMRAEVNLQGIKEISRDLSKAILERDSYKLEVENYTREIGLNEKLRDALEAWCEWHGDDLSAKSITLVRAYRAVRDGAG